MSTQHTEVRDHLHFQARDQERAFPSQKSAATQIGINVQNANAQVEAILALQCPLQSSYFLYAWCKRTEAPYLTFRRGSTPFQKQMLQLCLMVLLKAIE